MLKQIIGSAHGDDLVSLVRNKQLCTLVGGTHPYTHTCVFCHKPTHTSMPTYTHTNSPLLESMEIISKS